jgi:ParB-like chromosome segregation protein Spo0J
MNELQVRLCPVYQLVPYQKNASTHSEEQIGQLATSIQAFGWTNPILVGPYFVVIAGHARLAEQRSFGLLRSR